MSTQPKFCRNCGSQIAPGSNFCENCGQKLAKPAETSQPPPSQPPETPPPSAPPPSPPPPPAQPSEPVAQGIPVAGPPAMPAPAKKKQSKMWAVLAIAAIVVIIIAGVGYCITQSLEDDLVKIKGTFSKTASSGETITDNSIEFSIDPETRKVEGKGIYRIENARSYSKTIIVMVGTYTPSTSGGGTVSGTATSTYDKKIDGVDSSDSPKTSSWNASIGSTGTVTGKVGSDSYTGKITSGSLNTSGSGSSGDAEFKVTNLRVSPTGTIDLGNSQDFSIYIDVENTGGEEGVYKPEMTINGESVGGTAAGLKLDAGEKETGYSLILAESKIETLYLVDYYDGDIETTKYTVNVDGLTLSVYVE